MGIVEFLLLAENLPFMVSLGTVGALFTIELFSMLMGLGVSDLIEDWFDFDTDVDVDVDTDLDIDVDADVDVDANFEVDTPNMALSFLSWLQVGKVPFLILFTAFLAAFGSVGIILQFALISVIGTALSPLIAGPVSFLASLPLTRLFGKGFSRILPKETTSAIMLEDLRGNYATITIGTAKLGKPTEAKTIDQHGTVHYVRVEPANPEEEFTSGTTVTLVEKEGNVFRVTAQNSEGE